MDGHPSVHHDVHVRWKRQYLPVLGTPARASKTAPTEWNRPVPAVYPSLAFHAQHHLDLDPSSLTPFSALIVLLLYILACFHAALRRHVRLITHHGLVVSPAAPSLHVPPRG